MDDGRRARTTVVTRGERGCTADVGGETIDVPGYPVEAVSTLGAGDVFHGALLAALVRGLELRDALALANRCAALSCRALDGRSAIPTWEEL
jgi:sugar/nucleoside kinase (ribokinase family)